MGWWDSGLEIAAALACLAMTEEKRPAITGLPLMSLRAEDAAIAGLAWGGATLDWRLPRH